MTELGVDYVTRQVPAAKERRDTLRRATGSDTIPVLVAEDGAILTDEDTIRAYLDRDVAEPSEAEAHRLKAANVRRRYLEEECECSPAPTS